MEVWDVRVQVVKTVAGWVFQARAGQIVKILPAPQPTMEDALVQTAAGKRLARHSP